MRERLILFNNSGDFLKKINGVILVTADALGLYRNVPHKVYLKTLRKRFNERETSEIITEDIAQLAEFFLKMFF